MADSTGPIRDEIDRVEALAGGQNVTDSEAAQAAAEDAADRAEAVGYMLAIPIDLAAQGNGDVVTDAPLGHAFQLTGKPFFVVTEALVGSTKTVDLVMDIGATAVTGGSVTVASANATKGTSVQAGAAFSALNTGLSTDVISVRVANATAFTTGKGVLYVRVKFVA